MPTVNVAKTLLFEKLGETLSDEAFDVLCFQFGIELDDVVEEGGVTIYKIDIPANRYDLLCVEGLCRAIRIFQEKEKPPIFRLSKEPGDLVMHVDGSVADVRPFVVTAVLRNLTIDAATYESIIALQEKLHGSLCRKRSLVAIGVHDLDSLTPPFSYQALEGSTFKFIPLGEKAELSGAQIVEKYSKHAQLKPYAALLKNSTKLPLIKDSKGVVLSLPPLINGEHSKMTTNTKNIYIEATATDQWKARVVLDVLVAAFSCGEIETTRVVYSNGNSEVWPKMESRRLDVCLGDANSTLGLKLKETELTKLLAKMGLEAEKTSNEGVLNVEVPPWRHDILHAVDVFEDAAIAFGYDNLPSAPPQTPTVALQQPLNKVSEKLRHEIAMAGFTEALTFALCSAEDEEAKLLNAEPEPKLVRVKNPKAAEFTAARCSLLPGLLKTANGNKSVALPLRLFEISDVVWKDNEMDASNRRHFGAINYNKRADMQVIHGLVDRFFRLLNVPQEKYALKHATHLPWLLPGRSAAVYYDGKEVGWVGEVHPDVLTNFDLSLPVAALEIHIEPFV